MAYPSIISVLPNPQPTDRLNSPSHSSLHQSENTGIIEVQTFLGTLASAQGTISYDVRSPNSNGGGHVQTAITGGTGQITYNKGDLLVASSSSVLTKFAVSSTAGEILTVDPNSATGVKWGPAAASTKITTQITNISRSGATSSGLTVLFATSILGSTLGTSNAIRYNAQIQNFSKAAGATFTGTVTYGNGTIDTFTIPSSPSVVGAIGIWEGYIVASSVLAQLSMLNMNMGTSNTIGPAINPMYSFHQGGASVNSAADQNLIIQGQFSNTDNVNSILTGLFVVEKIV